MSKDKLKTLEEYNADVITRHDCSFIAKPSKNGIACPNCQNELHDTSPNVTLTSMPAQKYIGCTKCGYAGYRYV